MTKHTNSDNAGAPPTQHCDDARGEDRPIDRVALLDAIEKERQRIFRARALAQTAAKLLHELFVLEKDEPDIGFVLDVVSDMLEESLAGLDRVTLQRLGR